MTSTLFDRESLPQPRITLAMHLAALRKIVPQELMPSAEPGRRYMSKPDYIHTRLRAFPDYPHVSMQEYTGLRKFTCWTPFDTLSNSLITAEEERICFHLTERDGWQIYVNLSTLRTIVRDARAQSSTDWIEWPDKPIYSLPVNLCADTEEQWLASVY